MVDASEFLYCTDEPLAVEQFIDHDLLSTSRARMREYVEAARRVGPPMASILKASDTKTQYYAFHIEMATWYAIEQARSDEEKVSIRRKILGDLLAERDLLRFNDHRFEFEVRTHFMPELKSLRWEPPAGKGDSRLEFVMRVNDWVIYVECTRVRVPEMTDFHKFRRAAAAGVAKLAAKTGLALNVELVVPRGVKEQDWFDAKPVLTRNIPFGLKETEPFVTESGNIRATYSLGGNDISVRFAEAIDLESLVRTHVENRLQDKREQFQHRGDECLLAVDLVSDLADDQMRDIFSVVIREQMLRHEWISALLLFPLDGAGPLVVANPTASQPITPGLAYTLGLLRWEGNDASVGDGE